MNDKTLPIVAFVLILGIAIGGYFFPKAGAAFGGITNYDTVSASGLAIGVGCNSFGAACGGTTITQVIKGTGILVMPNYSSLAASTTLAADIAVTGVVSGDTVFAQFATSTANGAGWEVVGVSASSTSGFITLRIINNTGTTATIPASIASTTQYLILR
jgi:hypothetical protein